MTTREKIDAIFSDVYMEEVFKSVEVMIRHQMTKRKIRELVFSTTEEEYPYIDCSDMKPTDVSDKLQEALLSIQNEILFSEEKFIDALRKTLNHTYCEQKKLLGFVINVDLETIQDIISNLQHLKYEWLSFLDEEELRRRIICEILFGMMHDEDCCTLYLEYAGIKEKSFEKK